MDSLVNNKLKIIRVPIHTPTLWPHTTTNCYLIGNESESILIDAGYDVPETKVLLEKALKEHQFAPPKAILLTHYHPDHAPGVKRLTEWNPVVYCHEFEVNEIKKNIAPWDKISLIKDGETIKIAGADIQIMHTPGHTPGHLNVYIPSMEILLAGDNIVAEGTSWIGPPDGDMRDFLQTLTKLKSLKLQKIGPGHGNWVDNPYEHIDFVYERRLSREKQIIHFLKENKKLTAENITKMIYQDSIHPSLFEVAKRTTEAHLKKLMEDGVVNKENSDYFLI